MRSIRLLPKDINELNRLTGLPGEVFYDKSSNSLRVFDGSSAGGHELLRADATNLAGIISIAVSETPPSATASGSLWFNSATGGLFVYYKDGSSDQWMQPVIPVGVVGNGTSFRAPTYSSSARNALTPSNGDIIYNTTTNKFNGYQNGIWIELDTGTAA